MHTIHVMIIYGTILVFLLTYQDCQQYQSSHIRVSELQKTKKSLRKVCDFRFFNFLWKVLLQVLVSDSVDLPVLQIALNRLPKYIDNTLLLDTTKIAYHVHYTIIKHASLFPWLQDGYDQKNCTTYGDLCYTILFSCVTSLPDDGCLQLTLAINANTFALSSLSLRNRYRGNHTPTWSDLLF